MTHFLEENFKKTRTKFQENIQNAYKIQKLNFLKTIIFIGLKNLFAKKYIFLTAIKMNKKHKQTKSPKRRFLQPVSYRLCASVNFGIIHDVPVYDSQLRHIL